MAAALVTLAAVVAAPLVLPAGPASAAQVTVVNRTQPRDTAGNALHAHGGGVIKVGDYYYWFGESRNADSSFLAVNVYRSQDLARWEYRGQALNQSSAAELGSSNIERPKVVYNRATGKFVMWMHKENAGDYSQARAAVAVADNVEGPYGYRGSFRPFNQHMSRDITLFVDDDGAGYMASAANENYDLNVYRLTDDYTDVSSLVRSWPGDHREAPALFKRNGVYFMLTSGATGWNPNQQKYSTATSLSGTWSGWQNAGDSTTYGTQTAHVFTVQGSQGTSYVYLGDRWGPGFGGVYADSQYVWLPLRFPSSTSLAIDYYSQITVDTATGVVAGVPEAVFSLAARHSGKCADVVNASSATLAELIQYTCGGGENQKFTARDAGSGYVQLVARHSGLCLDVSGTSTADSARIIQYTCGGGDNQKWQFQDAGNGYYRLVVKHSGKCLDVVDASTANGARLVQYTCNGGLNQQWQRR